MRYAPALTMPATRTNVASMIHFRRRLLAAMKHLLLCHQPLPHGHGSVIVNALLSRDRQGAVGGRREALQFTPPFVPGNPMASAAERSGNRCGSDLSNRNRATNDLIGLPRPEVATGLADTKSAVKTRSG